MKTLLFLAAFLFPASAFAQAIVVTTCGSVNYTAAVGQLHALTMNTAGYLCVSSTTLLTATGAAATKDQPATEEPKK